MQNAQNRDEWKFIQTPEGPLKPGFQVVSSDCADFAIISNSAGGAAAKEYPKQLQIILETLTAVESEILRIEVDSNKTSHLELSQRILKLHYPIDMSVVEDHAALRLRLSSAQKYIGQEPGASGGNGNKRIRIHVRSAVVTADVFLKQLLASDGEFLQSKLTLKPENEADQSETLDDLHEEALLNLGLDGPLEILQLVKARRGQGIFRTNVESREPHCRITGVSNPRYLRASHIKPWRKSTDIEKLDGSNGLMLAPHIDLLFDQGFISFEDDGTLIVSKKIDEEVLGRWDIPVHLNVGAFTQEQCAYLEFHRKNQLKS